MFLFRLNEVNGSCEKILPVWGSFWILLRGCEGEMWEWMEFYRYFPSETFVVVTADQKVGRGDGPLEQQ